MVLFDNNFLMISLRKDAIPASVTQAKERVQRLIGELDSKGEKIVIPTPALAEFLVHAGSASGTYLSEIQKSSVFRIASFDTLAAIEVSIDIANSIKKKDKLGGTKGTWAKANFDRQIAAIAKVQGAHTIYSDDGDIENPAKRMGIKVVSLKDLPLPESKTPLLDYIEQIAAESKGGKTQKEQKEKAESTHPSKI